MFFSCQKSGNGYVRGTVIDASTGNPAEGVPVMVILETRQAKGQSYYTTDTVSSTLTSSDGTYKINFKKYRGWANSYMVALGENNKYFYEGNTRNIDMKKTAVNFNVYEKAYAKIKITKTTTKPTRISIQIGQISLSSAIFLQTSTFTDSLVQFVFTVRGNYSSKACVKAEYVNDNFKLDYCSSEKYIQVGDTAIFTVTYD